jgi:hypothetical protein
MKTLFAVRFGAAVLFIFLATQACQLLNPSAPKNTKRQVYFFDLAGFFDQEAIRLTKGNVKAEKELSFNDKKGHLPSAKLDFVKELAVFVNSDINKLSWRDKYQADTLYGEGHLLQKIQYKALDEQLKTRQVMIEYTQGKVVKIEIQNRLKSIIAQSEEKLSYEPTKGYSINGLQQMILAGKNTMEVEVRFKNGL